MANSRKRSKFFKKNALKNAGPSLGRSVVRVGGGIAGHTVTNRLTANISQIPQRAAGAVPFLLGVAGELFIEEPNIRAFAEGMTVQGGIQLAADNAPQKVASMVGLSGVREGGMGALPTYHNYERPRLSGLGASGDVDSLIRELEAEARREGMAGLGSMAAEVAIPEMN